jgi:hypothetical protein
MLKIDGLVDGRRAVANERVIGLNILQVAAVKCIYGNQNLWLPSVRKG